MTHSSLGVVLSIHASPCEWVDYEIAHIEGLSRHVEQAIGLVGSLVGTHGYVAPPPCFGIQSTQINPTSHSFNKGSVQFSSSSTHLTLA